MVGRRIAWPAHDLQPMLFIEPLACRVEQPVGDLLIVDRLEKSPETDTVVVAFEMPVVDDRSDPSDGLLAAHGDERLNFVGVVKRMMLVVHQLLLLDPKRRNPVFVVLVNLPRQIQKPFFLGTRRYGDDLEIGHFLLAGIIPSI